MKTVKPKTKTEILITPGHGAEEFAQMLKKMYEANPERDFSGEHGVHRLLYVPKSDTFHRRHTVFCTVAAGGDPTFLDSPEAMTRRSYILAPYKLAKDHVTGKETKDVDAVLAGNLGLLS